MTALAKINGRLDKEAIRSAAAGRWLEILTSVCGIAPEALDGKEQSCLKCGGKTRFRLMDAAKGAVRCSHCFQEGCGDGFAAVMWARSCALPDALKLVADSIGYHGHNGELRPIGIVEKMARVKKVSLPSWLAFGAREDKRGKLTVCRLPMYGEDGSPCSYCDFADTDDKFRKGISAKGMPVGLYYAAPPETGDTILITEGPKDAAALHSLGFKPVGTPGSKLDEKFARVFRDCHVIIVPDLDTTGQDSAQITAARLVGIAASVRIARLPGELKATGGDGAREALAQANGEQLVRQAIEDAVPWEPTKGGKSSDKTRCDVDVLAEEHRTISAVVAELPRAVNVYQRGGSLVRILDDFRPQDLAIDRHQPASRIGELPLPSLREQITRLVRLSQPSDESGSEFHPPDWLIKGVASRGIWPGVPHLEAVVPNPVFSTDGTIASQRGYDSKTGLYIDSDIVVTVPDHPTQEDAKAAVERLLFLVSDFPFQRLYHKSAWLAFLLTLLVRFAFNGPTPFFLADASTPGSGKTLLVELVVLIVTGKKLPRMSLPEADDEFRKVITALAMCGASIVLFDNIATVLGCASLDAALTSTIWRDRPLGRTEIAEFPLSIVWSGSGNNVQLRADTGRRICHIRLQAMEEHPENRSDFTISNIVQHILENRAEYLSAAFTILKAYHVAGRPDVKLPAWGSYEAWSAAVRAPLVWCGLADPASTREEFIQYADREVGMLGQLLAGWEELDPARKGLTVAEAIRLFNGDREAYPTLRQALEELAPPKDGKFSNKSIGKRLTHLRGRICSGRAFDSRLNSSKVQSWSITQVVSPQVATNEPAKAATDSPDKSGFTGFAGFNSPPLKEEMNNTTDTHIHTHTLGGEINPVNPSNPESDPADWLDGVTFPT